MCTKEEEEEGKIGPQAPKNKKQLFCYLSLEKTTTGTMQSRRCHSRIFTSFALFFFYVYLYVCCICVYLRILFIQDLEMNFSARTARPLFFHSLHPLLTLSFYLCLQIFIVSDMLSNIFLEIVKECIRLSLSLSSSSDDIAFNRKYDFLMGTCHRCRSIK